VKQIGRSHSFHALACALGAVFLASLSGCVAEVPDEDGSEADSEETLSPDETLGADYVYGDYDVEAAAGGCSNEQIRNCVGECGGTVNSCDASGGLSSSYYCYCRKGGFIWVLE
jgi:hypothetical protein